MIGRRDQPGASTVVRVMLEHGKKKRVVACAFDWPGWDRSTKLGGDPLGALESYRQRFAPVAARAGYGDEFDRLGPLEVVEDVEGIGMTDHYGVSGRPAAAEHGRMSDADLDRKVALLQAAWATFDDAAERVSAELRRGPRGGGRDKEHIVRHVNGAEIQEFAPKVGVEVPLETRDDSAALEDYRAAVTDAIRDHAARDAAARSWQLQFLIRRCAWHMLDHAWELEDRDLTDPVKPL